MKKAGSGVFILSILLLYFGVGSKIVFAKSYQSMVDTLILSGTVHDSKAQPIAGVQVKLKTTDSVYSQLTDLEGHFAFQGLHKGHVELFYTKEGYHNGLRQLNFQKAPANLDLILIAFTAKLKQVVVTGMYKPAGLQRSIYRVRVIDKQAINRRHAADLLDVLKTITGVRMSTDQTLGETDISLLGMGGQNIKVLLDGMPLLDRGATKNSLSQVDLHTIQRIEIVEGPLSVMYGADALAGVINLITKVPKAGKATVKPPKYGHLAIALNLLEQTAAKQYQFMDNQGLHNANLSLHWQKGPFFADGTLTRNNFGGWQKKQNAGKRAKDWLPKEQWLGGGRVGFRGNEWRGWYRYQYLQEDIWSYGEVNPNTATATDKEYLTDRSTHQINIGWRPVANYRLSLDGSYQVYSRRTRTTSLNMRTGVRNLIPDPSLQERSDFNSGFVRLTGFHKMGANLDVLVGTELTYEKGAGPRIEGTLRINNYALFVSGEYQPVRWIAIRPGVRFSKNTNYDAPPVIPAMNAKINLNQELSLRLSYARGFRAPALRELYFWFFDANHSIKGNDKLKAEYAHAYSASLSWRQQAFSGGQLFTDLNIFYNDYHNRIELALNSALGSNVYTYINLSKYKTLGTSLHGNLQSGNLHAGLGFSYIGQYNTYVDDPEFYDDHLPAFVWSPELSADLDYRFTRPKLQLSLQYKFTGTNARYEIDQINGQQRPFLARTSAFNWLDFSASKSLIRTLKLSAGVKNIFNITDLNNTSLGGGQAHNTGGPLPLSYGRSYFVGINWRWP